MYFTEDELLYDYFEKFLYIDVLLTSNVCKIYKVYAIKDGNDITIKNIKLVDEYISRLHKEYNNIRKIYNEYNLYDGHPHLHYAKKLTNQQKKTILLYSEKKINKDNITYEKIYYGDSTPKIEILSSPDSSNSPDSSSHLFMSSAPPPYKN